VPFDELKPSLDAAYRTIASQVNVPGFRRGKVPPRIIDQRIGRGAVLEEAINDALPGFISRAVSETEVRPLGEPTVNVTELPDLAAGGELTFTIEVDVRPELVLPDLDSVEITVDDAAVTAEEVDTEVESLRARFGTLTPVDRTVGADDFVTIDVSAEIDGEQIDSVTGVSYQLGTGTMLDGMDDALLDLSAGESTTFESHLAGGDRVGESAQVAVTVQAVKERVLPDLNDEFAQLASEFDTLEELLEDLRVKAAATKQIEQVVQARERLLEYLLACVEVPAPESVVSAEVQRRLESENRLEDEDYRAEVEEKIRTGIRTQLLLDAVATVEQVSIGQQELVEHLVMSAEQYGMDPNDLAKAVEESGQVQAMVGEVARKKGLLSVLSRATVKDASGSVVGLEGITVSPADGDSGEGVGRVEGVEGARGPAATPAPAGSVPPAADPAAVPVMDLPGFVPDDASEEQSAKR
jgi:trigger factor